MENLVIGDMTVVELEYEWRLTDADGSERSFPARKVSFVFGMERQLPALEKALAGLTAGREVEVSLAPEELAGPRDEGLVMEIPRKGLKSRRLAVGRVYREIRNGCLYTFTPREIREHTVLADFNQPGRGSSALVRVRVLEVRPASDQDIREAAERRECAASS